MSEPRSIFADFLSTGHVCTPAGFQETFCAGYVCRNFGQRVNIYIVCTLLMHDCCMTTHFVDVYIHTLLVNGFFYACVCACLCVCVRVCVCVCVTPQNDAGSLIYTTS